MAPVGRDSELACKVFEKSGLYCRPCVGMDEIDAGSSPEAGAVLLTEEALSPETVRRLSRLLRRQPNWSDLPLIILIDADRYVEKSTILVNSLGPGRNIIILERPTSSRALASVVRSALEARRRQYQVRDLLHDLKLSAERLDRSNKDLQEFAFVASHDLKEPLRKITAFGARLEKRCENLLDEQGRDYLKRMMNAAGRMSGLIEKLLEFSRVVTQARPFEPIDLGAIVREVVNDLEVIIEQTNGQVEVGELTTIEADPVQMRRLFQNLIGNALKFQRNGNPIVKVYGCSADEAQGIKALTENGVYHIYVEDNGIGFDEKHLDRVFAPFQRLHGRSEFEGTGMGLAICRKIVERHGGSITAKSSPGKGTTFILTLPVRQSEDK
jgi:light-regulated signal transduction histidine kinase (bacteriophytochrome)